MSILGHEYSVQETGYWCGPGSSQIVLTARGINVPEPQLARELGTTTNGTDWIGQITTLLGRYTRQPYITREIPNDPPTANQVALLREDVKRSIDGGNGVVANIVAPPGNQPPGYPRWETIYHYVAIVGCDEAQGVYVADPARFGGYEHYWLTWEKMASLISPKGYAVAPTGAPTPPPNEDDDDAAWLPILTQLVGPQ